MKQPLASLIQDANTTLDCCKTSLTSQSETRSLTAQRRLKALIRKFRSRQDHLATIVQVELENLLSLIEQRTYDIKALKIRADLKRQELVLSASHQSTVLTTDGRDVWLVDDDSGLCNNVLRRAVDAVASWSVPYLQQEKSCL